MQKWIVLFSVGIFILLANLDMTIVNLALAELSLEFVASMQQVQLVIVSYLAAAAVFFCIAGKLADFFGAKRIFLLGSFLFVFASLLLGVFSQTINQIIFLRFIQGLGFAATLGLALLLIVRAFPADKKGLATGIAVALTGIGLALGPPIGGFILQYFGWRWIFLMNVPLGVLSILLTYLFVEKDKKISEATFAIDIIGLPLYISGLLILVYLPNILTKTSIINLILLSLLCLLLIIFFVQRCLKSPFPLINIALLKNKTYLVILIIRMIFMFVMASFLFILPLYMQNILNYSKFYTGIWLICMTASVAFVSPLTGKLIDAIGYKIPVLVSMFFLVVSCVSFLNLQVYLSITFLAIGLLSFGLSNGMHVPSTINGAISQSAPEHSGSAVGLFFTIALIGSMFGVAISGFVIDQTSHYELMQNVGFHTNLFSQSQMKILFSIANGSQNLYHWYASFPNISFSTLQKMTSDSFIYALKILILLDLSFTIIASFLCLLLFKKRNMIKKDVL